MIDIKAADNRIKSSGKKDVIEPDIRLYTNATHGGIWLLYTVDAALFLIKKFHSERNENHKPIHVEISFFPVYYSQLNPLVSVIIQTVKKLSPVIPDVIKNKLPDRFKLNPSYQKESIYHRLYSYKKVNFHYHQDTITLSLFNNHSLRYILLYYSSYVPAIFYWLSCYQGMRFSAQKFLNLQYKHIPIGERIASSTLRNNPQFAGSLKPCLSLFQNLIYSICIINICYGLSVKKKSNIFAFFNEFTFYQYIYQKAFHYLGANTIEVAVYDRKYAIIGPDQPHTLGLLIHGPIQKSCNPAEKKRVDDYMNMRIFQAADKITTMDGKENDNFSQEIKDLSGNIVPMTSDKLFVVLFLHSFDDGQYSYGIDGFDDIYHWVLFTIDNCLKNPSIDMILIKSHPCDDPILYPGDKIALENLRERYRENKRVVFIEKSSSIVFMAKNARLFGITHHGSIAEELVYLHQPVIASTVAPWQSFFPFVKTWQNPAEYEKLLSSLSLKTWASPTESELQSLYTFILEYRLNEYRSAVHFENKLSPWANFTSLFPGESIYYNQNYDKWEQILQAITSDDIIFQKYLDVAYESN